MADLENLIPIMLVPVEVFGTDGYGLMDAVSSWSDCNRAAGKIYRVEDIPNSHRDPREVVTVYVEEKDLPFFEKIWGDPWDEVNAKAISKVQADES